MKLATRQLPLSMLLLVLSALIVSCRSGCYCVPSCGTGSSLEAIVKTGRVFDKIECRHVKLPADIRTLHGLEIIHITNGKRSVALDLLPHDSLTALGYNDIQLRSSVVSIDNKRERYDSSVRSKARYFASPQKGESSVQIGGLQSEIQTNAPTIVSIMSSLKPSSPTNLYTPTPSHSPTASSVLRIPTRSLTSLPTLSNARRSAPTQSSSQTTFARLLSISPRQLQDTTATPTNAPSTSPSISPSVYNIRKYSMIFFPEHHLL